MDVGAWLNQDAIYWPPEGWDGDAPLYGTPVRIDCRWEDIIEEIVTSGGEIKKSGTKVLTEVEVEENGVLKLGDFSTLIDLEDPFLNEKAFRIQKVGSIPDKEGDIVVYQVWL